MALLKLPRVSRATTLSDKEFQVDTTLRSNASQLFSIEKSSREILKRWPREIPLRAETNISSGHIPHLLWNIFQHLMTSVLSNLPSTENKSPKLWYFII